MGACGSTLHQRQLEVLQRVVSKHIQDPGLITLVDGTDFSVTSTERGLQNWEQQHLVAALDILNSYQIDRCRRASCGPGLQTRYVDDPRTRFVELLKRWLRVRAGMASVAEEDIRSVCGLCREVLATSVTRPELFRARNPRSFLRAIAEVYDHLRWQHRELLERDRSCAEAANRVASLCRNLLTDVIGYLLVAPTDLRQTDELPSLEVVALWQSLPSEGNPLPDRADPALQRAMGDAWRTRCGSLIAALLGTPWCIQLFDAVGAREPKRLDSMTMSYSRGAAARTLLAKLASEFGRLHFKDSGLAGAFRAQGPGGACARKSYLVAAECAFDLAYLVGDVFTHFRHVGNALGDYGAVSVGPWLHPFLGALVGKLQLLCASLEDLNKAFEDAYVLARARGKSAPKPGPSSRMCLRAHTAIERAVTGRGAHMQMLLQAVEDLRSRTAPERLPHIVGGLGDALCSLQQALASPEFHACAGATAAVSLPLPDAPAPLVQLAPIRGETESLQWGRNTIKFGNAVLGADDQSVSLATGGDAAQAGSDASQTRDTSQDGDFTAEVKRLVPATCGLGLKQHDYRSLRISGGDLHICEPGSKDVVKMVVNVSRDVDECRLLRGSAMLSLAVVRPSVGADAADGVVDHKSYIFEFLTKGFATDFHNRITQSGDAAA